QAKHNATCDQPSSHLRIEETHEARPSFRNLNHSGGNGLNHASASTAANSILRIGLVLSTSACSQTVAYASHWDNSFAVRFNGFTEYVLHLCGCSKTIDQRNQHFFGINHERSSSYLMRHHPTSTNP